MSEGSGLWIQVCEQLKWHNRRDDTCIATLNRLWRKNVYVRGPNRKVLLEVPTLSEEMLTVHAEQWPLSRLAEVRRGHDRDQPKFFPPIVILNWLDQFFLIDGNTRVNYWLRKGNAGPHAVFRIAER